MEYLWRSKRQHPERFGQPCTLVSMGRGLGVRIIVKFADGQRVVAVRQLIKLAPMKKAS